MSYYDNIKDSVQDEGGSDANFDSLKEAAQESSDEDEKGDDTEIEVLEEGLNSQPSGKTRKQKKREQRKQSSDAGDSREKEVSPSQTGLEEKLDRIIQQNERMIQVLERMV